MIKVALFAEYWNDKLVNSLMKGNAFLEATRSVLSIRTFPVEYLAAR